MLVTRENMRQVIDSLRGQEFIGLDSEGYGLEFDDRLFAISLAGFDKTYYLNFYDGPDYLGNHTPDKYIMPYLDLAMFLPVFMNPNITWFIHNASHDLQKFSYEGIEINGKVVCTKISERVLHNNLGPKDYSLAKCAERRGWHKLDLVEECITKNKLYTQVVVPGKKKREKRKHFEKVPFMTLAEYAERDAWLHRAIGLQQRNLVYGQNT